MNYLILLTTTLCGGVGAALGCLLAQHVLGAVQEWRHERAARAMRQRFRSIDGGALVREWRKAGGR